MAWYNDVWNETKNVGKRIGQGVGLIGPDDMIDEQGATSTAQGQATQAFQKALEQYGKATDQQGLANDLYKYGAGLPSTVDPLTAPQITGVAPIQQQFSDWKQAAPVRDAVGVTAGPTRNVELGPVETTMTGPEQIPISQASTTTAGRTTIDPLATDLRGEQLDAARALVTGPSAADAQMKAGLATTTEEALGMVNQARGADRGASRLAALQALATGGVKAAALGAEAKANETIARQRALVDALSGVRTQDASVAVQQAQMDARQKELNAQLETAVSQGNTEEANRIRSTILQLGQDAKKTSLLAGIDVAKAAADVAGETAGRQSTIDLANAQTLTGVNLTNTNAYNTRQDKDADRYTQNSQFNAGQGNQINTTNTANDILVKDRNAGYTQTTQQGNRDANFKQLGIKIDTMGGAIDKGTSAIQAGTGAIGQANNAAGTSSGIAGTIVSGQKVQQDAETESSGRLVKFVSTAGAAATGNPAAAAGASGATSGGKTQPGFSGTGDDLLPMSTSDENAKKDVRRISDEALLNFAEKKVQPVSFEYKPGYEDNGKERHGGFPSAQIFERDPVGKLFVSRDAKGTPHIDYGNFGAMLEAARIRESRKAARR